MERFPNFHQGLAEQLTRFLRDQIVQGELSNPAPSTRVWCRRLGVGRPSLLQALKVLETEGLVSVTSQGVRIQPAAKIAKKSNSEQRVARLLFLGRNYPDLHQCVRWLFLLLEGMQYHGITLSIERCSAQRLRTIASQKSKRGELCYLVSLPASYQRLFLENRKPAIVFGYPDKGVALPYVTTDLGSSVRHATQSLLRRGYKNILLISSANQEAGVVESIERFNMACAGWKDQPVRGHVELVWNHPESLRDSIANIVAKVKGPCGIIVFPPVPLSLLVTTVLKRGLSIPDQVEIVGIEYFPEDARLGVPVTLYSFPTQRFVKDILQATLHYFETGKVAALKRQVLLEPTLM